MEPYFKKRQKYTRYRSCNLEKTKLVSYPVPSAKSSHAKEVFCKKKFHLGRGGGTKLPKILTTWFVHAHKGITKERETCQFSHKKYARFVGFDIYLSASNCIIVILWEILTLKSRPLEKLEVRGLKTI